MASARSSGGAGGRTSTPFLALLPLWTAAAAAVVLLVASCAAATDAAPAAPRRTWDQLATYTFDDYVAEFGRVYASPVEHDLRRGIFERRLAAISAHNADPSRTWKMGVNHLTDRTDEEQRQLLGHRSSTGLPTQGGLPWQSVASDSDQVAEREEADEVDWRTKGIITPVKDQGQCGSCWTFGAAEALESYWAKATGQLPILSEQQILDCIPNPNKCGGTGGCQGGTAELVYQYLMMHKTGLASEWTYPYQSYHGDAFQCRFNASRTKVVASIKNYVVLPSNQYKPVIEALRTTGPLVINVDALSWHAYETGVFDGCNQTNPDINHVVQLVGYGTDSKHGDYWLIRNSWSPTWGEQGYIRIKRRSVPICGVDLDPRDGTGCEGGRPNVVVCGECGLLYDVSYPVTTTL